MKKMLKQLRPREWILALLCLAFVIVQVWLDLTLPDYMSQITTLVQTGGALGEILKAGAWMLACALGSMAAVAVAACAAKIGAVFSARLRAAQFDSVLSFSMEEINRFSTDSLITRATRQRPSPIAAAGAATRRPWCRACTRPAAINPRSVGTTAACGSVLRRRLLLLRLHEGR